MKIDVNRIPPEGLVLTEEMASGELDLETEIIKFRVPLKVKAEVSKITNALTVFLTLEGRMYANCSRCLEEFEIGLKKSVILNYPVDKSMLAINLDPDIRDQIILDYPIKPLCKADCKGICPGCGKNLNQGGCSCGST